MSASEPTVVPSASVPLPTTANGGTATPNMLRATGSSSTGGGSGTFGVKTGLAQMLKGG